MKSCRLIIWIIIIFFAPAVRAQKQLVILKNDKVVKRFKPGDDFVFTLKGSKRTYQTYINNLSDTAIVTHRDTIPLYQIDRIYFKQRSFQYTVGAALVAAGIGYFLVDQVNYVFVIGNKPELNRDVNRFSIPTIAIGLPLFLFRKKSQHIRHNYHAYVVTKESIFYKPDPSGYQSPYIPR